MTVVVVDQTRCALCGSDNSCGNVAGNKGCWCQVVEIPQALLEQVPKELQSKACICKRCVDSFTKKASS